MFFDNPGPKLKVLAEICFWLQVVAGMIYGTVLLIDEKIGLGLIVWLLVFPVSWLSNIVLYTIGDIAEDTADIRNMTYTMKHDTKKEELPAPEKEWNENIPQL